MHRFLFLIRVYSSQVQKGWQIPIIVEIGTITESTVADALALANNKARRKVSVDEELSAHWTEKLSAEAIGAPTILP